MIPPKGGTTLEERKPNPCRTTAGTGRYCLASPGCRAERLICSSEVELSGDLDDAHVLRAVVLPKVGSENPRARGRPQIVRSH